jgi:hypothetical protein
MAKQSKEITFIDQAFAIVEEQFANDGADKHGMKIADHKLLCRVLDQHEKYIDDKIIKVFIAGVAEHYKPIMASLSKLEEGQAQITNDMKHIKSDIADIRIRLFKHEERISNLESVAELPKGFDNRIKKLETYASIKWTVIRWIVAVIVAVLIGISLFLWHENNKLVTQNKVDEEQLDNYSSTVRGVTNTDTINGKK